MKKIIFIFSLLLVGLPLIAAAKTFTKKGKFLRIESGDYEHCIFLPKGEKEEIDLWPSVKPFVHCKKYLNKEVEITFRHEKIKIPEMYGSLDVLRLIKIVPYNKNK